VFAVGGAGLPMWGVMKGDDAGGEVAAAAGQGVEWNQSLTGQWTKGGWVENVAACRQRPQGCWRDPMVCVRCPLFPSTKVRALVYGVCVDCWRKLIVLVFFLPRSKQP